MSGIAPKDGAPRGFKIDRLAGFSDGVMAIAITILVLGLEVPSVHEVTADHLGDYLRASIHPALGYVTSFVLIGTYWIEHYVIFHFVTHATRGLILFNGFFLMCVAFLPFPTGLQAVYRENQNAMVLYSICHLLCGLSLWAIWSFASRDHRLLDPDVPPSVIRLVRRRILIVPVLSVAAIGASFIDIRVSHLLLLSIPLFYFSHRIRDKGWRQATGGSSD